jgi:PPOX class probable F420-dependent enzyme
MPPAWPARTRCEDRDDLTKGDAMPKPPMPDDTLELFRRPNPAVIAVLTPEGQPVSVATWYLVEDDGRILVNMDAERARVAWMRTEPRVALTALKEGEWYTHVSIRGRIVEWRDDPELVDIDRLSNHYGGQPYRVRDRARVSALIEVDHWHGWGAAKAKV